jgi:hypothetical protein
MSLYRDLFAAGVMAAFHMTGAAAKRSPKNEPLPAPEF